MPFKSEAQRRLFYAKAKRGEMSKATVKRWEDETPKKKLPERLHKNAQLGETMDRQLNGAVAAVSKLGLTKEAVVKELRTLQRLKNPLLPRISGRALQPGQLVPRANGEIGVYGGPAVTDALEASLQNARRRYGTKAPKALADYEQLVARMRETAANTPGAQPITSIAALPGGQESRVLPGRRIELGAASAPEAMLAAQEATSGRSAVADALSGGAMAAARNRGPDLQTDLLLEVAGKNRVIPADFMTRGYALQTGPADSVAQLRQQAEGALRRAAAAGSRPDGSMRSLHSTDLAGLESRLKYPFGAGQLRPMEQTGLMLDFGARVRRDLPEALQHQLGLSDPHPTFGY